MDEKPEPPAEDDSPGRPRTGAVARRTLTADLLDPRALLTRSEGDRLRGLLDALCDHLAADGLTGEIRAEVVDDERMSALHKRYKHLFRKSSAHDKHVHPIPPDKSHLSN